MTFETVTLVVLSILIPMFCGLALSMAWGKRHEPAYPLIGMVTSLLLATVLCVGTTFAYLANRVHKLEDADPELRGLILKNAQDTLMAPLVEEIYQRLRALEGRCPALPAAAP